MIVHITGTLLETGPQSCVIETGGLGYAIRATSRTLTSLGDNIGGTGRLLIRQITRETGSELYGFSDREERTLFDLLTGHVSGIGPKSALAVLEGMTAERFKKAVVANDPATLSAAKGVGKKTAERIILELRDKIKIAEVWEAEESSGDKPLAEAILALMALGVTKTAAEKAAQAARREFPDADSETLTKEAIRKN